MNNYPSGFAQSKLTPTAAEFTPRSGSLRNSYARTFVGNGYDKEYRSSKYSQYQYPEPNDFQQQEGCREYDSPDRRVQCSDRRGDYSNRHDYRQYQDRSHGNQQSFYNKNEYRGVNREKSQNYDTLYHDDDNGFCDFDGNASSSYTNQRGTQYFPERGLEYVYQIRREMSMEFGVERNSNQNNNFRSTSNKFDKRINDNNGVGAFQFSTSNCDNRSDQYNSFSRTMPSSRQNNFKGEIDKMTFSLGENSICQRDRLIEQLNKGIHECLICCEAIKQKEPVWNCANCYYVLHMWCIIKWARSSTAETTCWRCPACQFEYVQLPEKYMCFCGKTKLHTEWNYTDTAHSCGEICGRIRENPTPWFVCGHRCTLLCHPGPCPPCLIQITRECGCGRSQQVVQCSTKIEINCGAICDRPLNCSIHRCSKICHFGDCGVCREQIKIECFCSKSTKSVTCGSDETQKWGCEKKCDRVLSCGNHKCDELCHPRECGLCPRAPIVLNTCMCGKMQITKYSRQSCLDDVPLCGEVCGKPLKCGPTNKKHVCKKMCHDGECSDCSKESVIKCRCGASQKNIKCSELNTKKADFRCQKKCSKKRTCGKHKCNQICCVDTEHICSQRCNGSLGCGKHRCELLCHRGKCGRCLQSSFEELYCNCGHSVIYPPVSCGSKPPECDQLCKRQHDCDHPPLHTCHSDETCPPCTVFTDKLCHGGHELRRTIPCYQKEFSCGLPCGAPLPCGVHKCQVLCHPGECLSMNKKCLQPCMKRRDICGHPCAAPCHTGRCPEVPCKEMVTVTCACGISVARHQCCEHTDDYRRVTAATLAAKMSGLQMTNSVKISDGNEIISAQTINLRTLECTDECKFILRNRRLALALQIQNPDLSAKLTPRYSDFMKSWAKKDPNLCRHIHDKLSALVQLAKESKQKNRSFSFEVMNKEKRQLVHEYCVHFGCESEAYDAEPKRNVVAIATKGRCWLPSYSLLEMVQREMGVRKVPAPIINKKTSLKEENNVERTNTACVILPVMSTNSTSLPGINYFGD